LILKASITLRLLILRIGHIKHLTISTQRNSRRVILSLEEKGY